MNDQSTDQGPVWTANFAEVYGRAVEVAHQRYAAVTADPVTTTKTLDRYVEILNWSTAMEGLCRVAHAAKKLDEPPR